MFKKVQQLHTKAGVPLFVASHSPSGDIFVPARSYRAKLKNNGELDLTKDAHGVYSKSGFKPLISPDSWLEI
jgi:hypothetical protein